MTQALKESSGSHFVTIDQIKPYRFAAKTFSEIKKALRANYLSESTGFELSSVAKLCRLQNGVPQLVEMMPVGFSEGTMDHVQLKTGKT